MMKRLMTVLLGGVMVLSLTLNVFLVGRLSVQLNQLKAAQASANEADELRQQNQELQSKAANAPDGVAVDDRELARLRNEVGQLRREVRETSAWRAQAAEAAQLRAKLATATAALARVESELADVAKLSPTELQQLKQEAHSVQCINHLKQIVLAARIWAADHNDVFPPDFLSMQQELNRPQILFCPADPAALRVTEWSQLTPSSVSYRWVAPNSNAQVPTNLLATCPIHGHYALSDGSAHRR